jgi:hypothetical protein
MDAYIALANSAMEKLKASPELTAAAWNHMSRETMHGSLRDLAKYQNLGPEDMEDIIAEGMETMTRAEMRSKLEDNGWEEDMIAESLKVVVADDSYWTCMFLDTTNPYSARLLHPCEVASFADKMGDADYWDDRRFTWKAIQEFAPTWAAANLVAITLDGEMITFPLPEPAGGRRKRGRTARRRAAKRKETLRV